jgi:hypothetical protein
VVRRTLIGSIAIAALATALSPRAATAYPWPVKPFDKPHPVRGSFGDPRTVFRAPATSAGVHKGAGAFSFHNGIDISASNGTAVYPVGNGTVTRVAVDKVVVKSENGPTFQYWHIAPSVRVGARVTARRTVLGRIARPSGHVHLTEIAGGRAVNPLQQGHISPYADSTRPWVARIAIRNGSGAELVPNLVTGRVYIVAEAYDRPALPVPGTWAGMPVTPALLTWRVETWTKKVVLADTAAWDVRQLVPPNSMFWHAYARGTYQNMAVFENHFSLLQPGNFVFRLVDTPLDTARLPNGVYDLVVTAADIRGNRSSRRFRFTIANPSDPGV